MKKRIGILTFHNVPNYGAVLQAYALKAYLEKDAENSVNVIDFRCKGNSDEFTPENYMKRAGISGNGAKAVIKKIMLSAFSKKPYCRKYEKFSDFIKNQLEVKEYKDIYSAYDILFCGSDQIWNYEVTGDFQKPYFGADKPASSQTRVASYGASCGDISEFPKEKKDELFSLVKKLDFIGVREKSLCEALVNDGVRAFTTMDPTFLLSAEEYKKAFCAEENEEKYILIYALRPDPNLDILGEKIAAQKGLKVRKICGYYSVKPEKGIYDAGPQEFIKNIANAEYVVTNSFHGTAFSLIFNKSFNVVMPEGRKGRITDLLETCSLTERICSNVAEAATEDIDFSSANALLEKNIATSKEFLRKVLN